MPIAQSKKIYISSLIAVGVLLLLAFAGNHFKHLLIPPADIQVAVDAQCDLRTAACQSVLSEGKSISFEITPNTLPVLQPLDLKVNTTGFEADAVQVNLVGVNMDMGINLTPLTKNTPNSFVGTTQIPACMHDKMLWEAQVILQTSSANINVPFRFYTKNK